MWTFLLNIAIRGIDWYLNKVKADDEVKKQWLEFIKATQHISKASVKILHKARAQRDRVRQMELEQQKGDKKK